MKTCKIVLFCLSMSISLAGKTQNDATTTALLSKVHNAYSQSTGIAINFNIRITHSEKKERYTAKGSAKLKKEAFYINIDGKHIWYDGQKQYTYDDGADEAYITNIEDTDKMFLNPINFLNNYSKEFSTQSKGKKQIAGKAVSIIQFIPKNQKGEIQKIVVGFYDSDSMMSFCEITNKDKQTTFIDISSYKNGQQIPPSTFSFDAKQNPNIEIIDLR